MIYKSNYSIEEDDVMVRVFTRNEGREVGCLPIVFSDECLEQMEITKAAIEKLYANRENEELYDDLWDDAYHQFGVVEELAPAECSYELEGVRGNFEQYRGDLVNWIDRVIAGSAKGEVAA
ncbi:MAG: hypothetical protein P8M80_07880 [Pirellulaceae bacterium]|nr:hypothetical protein [Pirellulaceae bacterium]